MAKRTHWICVPTAAKIYPTLAKTTQIGCLTETICMIGGRSARCRPRRQPVIKPAQPASGHDAPDYVPFAALPQRHDPFRKDSISFPPLSFCASWIISAMIPKGSRYHCATRPVATASAFQIIHLICLPLTPSLLCFCNQTNNGDLTHAAHRSESRLPHRHDQDRQGGHTRKQGTLKRTLHEIPLFFRVTAKRCFAPLYGAIVDVKW